MDALEESCQQSASFPCNLLSSGTPALFLDSTRRELLHNANRLFCDEGAVSVDILDVENAGEQPTFKCLRSRDDLQKTLGSSLLHQRRDPTCRWVFIYAPSSRDKLNITLEMMQKILSYYQVTPCFLENLFLFGYRDYGQDCTTTSFQCRNYLDDRLPLLDIPELGRSGLIMDQCYSLRGIERSESQPDWPWSIRLCAIYHSLDLDSAQATWIVIKANRLIEKLVRDGTKSFPTNQNNGDVEDAIARALRIHELIVMWCGSNWHWYINFLESMLQDKTRSALSVTLAEKPTPAPIASNITASPHASPASPTYNSTDLGEKVTVLNKVQSSLSSYSRKVRTITKRGDSSSVPKDERRQAVPHRRVAFKDLPQVHYIEEQASQAYDVLSNNVQVIEDLKTDYERILTRLEHSPADTNSYGDGAYGRFLRTVKETQKNMDVQKSRLEQLLKLLNDRKSLVKGILEYESMEANRDLAEKANITAQNMEILAVKTKLETVSMRIITLVTLFFLPGTFISTLMSTPIVEFPRGSPTFSARNISAGALGLFCAVSLPLVIFTFTIWYVVYWWENRKERKKVPPLSAQP